MCESRRGRALGCAPPSLRRPEEASTRGVSFDDLIGAGEDRWRDGQAESLGGVEIDDQLEGRRLLDWQIGGLGALENPAGVDASLARISGEARSIADQAAGRGELAP